MAANDFDPQLRDQAERALGLMRAQGFDQAQVSVGWHRQSELNVAHNEPSLLRSTEQTRVSLLGLLDGRRASTELSSLDDASLRQGVVELLAAAQAAPQDDANTVSSGQHARIVQGPLEADPALLADKMAELLSFRERETPRFTLEEAATAHHLSRSHTLTTGGSDLASLAGWLSLRRTRQLVQRRRRQRARLGGPVGGRVVRPRRDDARHVAADRHAAAGHEVRWRRRVHAAGRE
jgi:PmbA protein